MRLRASLWLLSMAAVNHATAAEPFVRTLQTGMSWEIGNDQVVRKVQFDAKERTSKMASTIASCLSFLGIGFPREAINFPPSAPLSAYPSWCFRSIFRYIVR